MRADYGSYGQKADCRPYELDEAARRRFAKRLYVGLPEAGARVAIVKRSLEVGYGSNGQSAVERTMQGVDNDLNDAQYEEVADLTEGESRRRAR